MTKDDLLPYIEEQERELVTMRLSHCAIRARGAESVYAPYVQPDPIPFGLLLEQDNGTERQTATILRRIPA